MKYCESTRCIYTDDGQKIYLTYLQGKFVKLLITNKEILTYETIANEIYYTSFDYDLKPNINYLRTSLAKKIKLHIKTINKAGYVLEDKIELT